MLETELFNVAARLSSTYSKEWKEWGKERSKRSARLQRNARTHLNRQILSHYQTRREECTALAKQCYHLSMVRLQTRVLIAWRDISKKRFSFRAFIIRTRNIMNRRKITQLFHGWRTRTFSHERVLWRCQYYNLMLRGNRSRLW